MLVTDNKYPVPNTSSIEQAVGQVAPQTLPDNLRVVPDKEICQGTRFARTLTYLRAIPIQIDS